MEGSALPPRQSVDQSYAMKPTGTIEYKDGGSDGIADESPVNRDEREMAYLGKKQELKASRQRARDPACTDFLQRRFGFMSMLGFTCTLLSTWEGIFVYVNCLNVTFVRFI